MTWGTAIRERLVPVSGAVPLDAAGLTVVLVVAAILCWGPAWQWVRLGATLVHEVGHAVVGILSGRRFTGFVVAGKRLWPCDHRRSRARARPHRHHLGRLSRASCGWSCLRLERRPGVCRGHPRPAPPREPRLAHPGPIGDDRRRGRRRARGNGVTMVVAFRCAPGTCLDYGRRDPDRGCLAGSRVRMAPRSRRR
jgi:hypothetical protein